jgi:hypothetical protein
MLEEQVMFVFLVALDVELVLAWLIINVQIVQLIVIYGFRHRGKHQPLHAIFIAQELLILLEILHMWGNISLQQVEFV